ncbi:Hsp70 family protein [Actinoplanes sp. NPDC089786]|uniref:Hsp70 family protein n=1 Tax=Actinoplanes sp. NPDC089786 TaxID=3155185 RepID=UPI00343E51B6
MDTYFGIDLGTTYSAIAYIDDTGRPTPVRNSMTNEDTTPSVVWFESADNVVVGRTAKDVAQLYPERVVSLVKRYMGKEEAWEFDGRPHTAESISALILKQLAQDAATYTGREVTDVVITVPAYFGMLERDATRNAGRIAGLNVVGIVPEPVAAALQYEVDGDRTVLVFDLGGGTFDTTVIKVSAGAVDVLCTDGDQELGGADWDARLADHLVQQFIDKASPDGDPRDDEQFLQEIARIAEDTKKMLSQAESRPVAIRYGGGSAMIEVSRAKFNELTKDLMDRAVEYTRRTIETLKSKGHPGTIDDVLLVGGSSKMPMVAERLTDEFGWTPRLHDPDLAVAKGAARFALSRAVWDWPGGAEDRIEQIARNTGIAPAAIEANANRKITNVLPKAFGVKLVDSENPDWERDPDAASYIHHLVHANESLPSGARPLQAQTVAEGQTAITIEIYEQAGSVESRDLSANAAVDKGAGEISGLPPLRMGSPIAISMQVDEEGTLSVHAAEPSTGKDLTIDVRVSVLSEEEVVTARQAVSAITVRA